MSVLKILKYPNPILREQCQPVESFDRELEKLVDDMLETMYDGPGAVGLAAPQVGAPVRLFIMDMNARTSRDECKILINPTIVQASRNKSMREGCLSFPDYLANVKRATKVTLQAFNQYGEPQDFEVRNLEAVCVQHEIDHLDGVLMIDRINSMKTDWIRRHNREPVESNDEMEEALKIAMEQANS